MHALGGRGAGVRSEDRKQPRAEDNACDRVPHGDARDFLGRLTIISTIILCILSCRSTVWAPLN